MVYVKTMVASVSLLDEFTLFLFSVDGNEWRTGVTHHQAEWLEWLNHGWTKQSVFVGQLVVGVEF